MKKQLCIVLAVLFLLLTGCGTEKEEPPEHPDAETGEAAEKDNSPAEGLSCTVIRGDASSPAVTQAAIDLRLALVELGFDVKITTDWVKKGEDPVRFPDEILIGPTEREESREVYAALEGAENPLDYRIEIGETSLIAAPESTIAEAAEVFAAEYVRWREAGKNYEVKPMTKEHVFPKKGLTIFGRDAGEWTLVIPKEYTAVQRADMAAISDLIYELAGVRVPVTDEASPSPAILVGTASPVTPRTDDLSCIAEYDGENLHIGGGNFWADIRALYGCLLYKGFRADYAGNAPDCPDDVTLASEVLPDKSGERFFSVSAWCTSGDAYDAEAQVKETAEAGFTKVNISGDGSLRRDLLKWCAIYDLQILWSGLGSYGTFAESDWGRYREAMDAPHVWGFYLRDEPNAADFPGLAESTRNAAAVTDQVAFINLFPMYANEQQLGNPTYEEHVEAFLDTVKPAWTSVDIYPCNAQGLWGGYMKNLDVVASACRGRGIPFSVYLQSVSFHVSKRTPSERDLEWQTWCIRSFGAREAIYFTYMTPYSTAEDFKPALIDHDLKKTDRWYAAQRINGEFSALDDAFARYSESLGAFTVNGSRTEYMQFENPYDFSAVLDAVETDAKLLVGCFSDGGSRYAFTLVNCEDLQRGGEASVRFRAGGRAVTVWQNGKSSLLTPDADGFVSVTLENGEGVFCEADG